ncbi:MAG: GtrA family protein [Candidatus Thermoplasmatota archaeon]|nr:GtrA family protein [Candidatus Thermoplasmatota archaeon]MCL5730699.1 GtrA family protein [Candidatus Thermoplasmatota archaeon]
MNRSGISSVIRSNLRRGSKFLIAGVGGFLFYLLVLYIGIRLVTIFYLPEIDVVSAFLSVVFGFAINEHWSTSGSGDHSAGAIRWLRRMIIFEGIYALGNVISIAIQLALYYYAGISPFIGSFIGTVIAFPFNYVLSMHLVWRINIFSQ